MVGSDRFKLLHDIYHMQIMEGDVIATIKANHDYIAHYHTGSVPGRNAKSIKARTLLSCHYESDFGYRLLKRFVA